MYYIGIDGGGTKTAFGLFNEDGHLLDLIELGTCHFLQVGYDGCALVLKEGIERLLEKQNIDQSCVKVGIGIAGYGNDQDIRHEIETHLQSALGNIVYKLTNDMHVALIGGLNNEDGIGVVAGTGTIAMAKVNDQIHRCGGWGYQLGDEGSGYWIGKQVLSHFCMQADGRETKDALYDFVMEVYKMNNPYEIIKIINSFDNMRQEVAKLAYYANVYANQSSSCKEILIAAGKHIASLVKGLRHYYTSQPLVTYYGGVFKSQIMYESFVSQLDDCQVVEPKYNAMYGAYLFVKE